MVSIKNSLISAWFALTTPFAIFAGLEGALRYREYLRAQASEPEDTGIAADIGSTKAREKQHEIDAAGDTAMYVPYVEFRERPYTTPTLNIDAESRRIVPASCNKPDAPLLLTFGGSTMFGAGVPDEYTIPNYLAAMLRAEGLCVRVVNYGSSWWQSTQSLIQLLTVLQRETRPRAVIFYDGINDVNAVTYGGKPGGIDPDTEAALRQVFEVEERSLLTRIAQNSLLVQAIRSRILPAQGKAPGNPYVIPEADRPRITRELVEIYAANVRAVEALGREFHFTPYFFLQPWPIIAGKKNTALEEELFQVRTKNRAWERDFIQQTYEGFRRRPDLSENPHFFDLSGTFDGLTEELYQDSEHLLPAGNKIVAERIFREIMRVGEVDPKNWTGK